jgi:hypothetical protein
MSIIKILSLNICNDDDLIYGSNDIKKLDIDNFITYHKIIDEKLINDINKINLNKDISYLDKSIISYNLNNNKLNSITINLNNKIRYINNLDPDIVDKFMTNKKKILYSTIVELDLDFILLQDLDIHYLPTEDEMNTILSEYDILNPFDIKRSYKTMLFGMLSNYIIYKKKYKLIDSYLKEYGTVGIFNIDEKHTKIISGRLEPNKESKSIRLNQLKQLDNETDMRTIFMGDTHLRYNELIPLNNIVDGIAYYGLIKLNTINKNINKYYLNDQIFMSRYDRIYINNVVCYHSNIIFNIKNNELVNKYRASGYISEHFGLIVDIYI